MTGHVSSKLPVPASVNNARFNQQSNPCRMLLSVWATQTTAAITEQLHSTTGRLNHITLHNAAHCCHVSQSLALLRTLLCSVGGAACRSIHSETISLTALGYGTSKVLYCAEQSSAVAPTDGWGHACRHNWQPRNKEEVSGGNGGNGSRGKAATALQCTSRLLVGPSMMQICTTTAEVQHICKVVWSGVLSEQGVPARDSHLLPTVPAGMCRHERTSHSLLLVGAQLLEVLAVLLLGDLLQGTCTRRVDA